MFFFSIMTKTQQTQQIGRLPLVVCLARLQEGKKKCSWCALVCFGVPKSWCAWCAWCELFVGVLWCAYTSFFLECCPLVSLPPLVIDPFVALRPEVV